MSTASTTTPLTAVYPQTTSDVASGLTPRQAEGLRIFGKVVLAVASAVAAVFAAASLAAFFPVAATSVVGSIGALSLGGAIAVLATCVGAFALSLFGMEQLGRSSGENRPRLVTSDVPVSVPVQMQTA